MKTKNEVKHTLEIMTGPMETLKEKDLGQWEPDEPAASKSRKIAAAAMLVADRDHIIASGKRRRTKDVTAPAADAETSDAGETGPAKAPTKRPAQNKTGLTPGTKGQIMGEVMLKAGAPNEDKEKCLAAMAKHMEQLEYDETGHRNPAAARGKASLWYMTLKRRNPAIFGEFRNGGKRHGKKS